VTHFAIWLSKAEHVVDDRLRGGGYALESNSGAISRLLRMTANSSRGLFEDLKVPNETQVEISYTVS